MLTIEEYMKKYKAKGFNPISPNGEEVKLAEFGDNIPTAESLEAMSEAHLKEYIESHCVGTGEPASYTDGKHIFTEDARSKNGYKVEYSEEYLHTLSFHIDVDYEGKSKEKYKRDITKRQNEDWKESGLPEYTLHIIEDAEKNGGDSFATNDFIYYNNTLKDEAAHIANPEADTGHRFEGIRYIDKDGNENIRLVGAYSPYGKYCSFTNGEKHQTDGQLKRQERIASVRADNLCWALRNAFIDKYPDTKWNMELTRDAMRMIASANFFNINRLSDEAIQENIDKIAEAVHDGIVHGATMFDFQMLPDDKKKFLKNIGKAELIYGDAHEFYGCGKDRTNDKIVSAIESAVKEGFITKKDFSREELEDAEKHLYDYDFNIVSHAAIDKFRKMFPEVGLYADPTDLAQEYIHTAMLAAAKDIEKDNKSLLQAFDGELPVWHSTAPDM